MSFVDDIRLAWGAGSAQDPEHLRQYLGGRSYWLWDPPENSEADKPYAHLLAARGDRIGCVRVGNPNELEAWFYPIDKALIPQQRGGQCEGVIWLMHEGERLCWIEMKMNITTHDQEHYVKKLEEALVQVQNTIGMFEARWEVQRLSWLPANRQRVAIVVPAKPRRLRQSPDSFQLKARRAMRGTQVFVLSEIVLPHLHPTSRRP